MAVMEAVKKSNRDVEPGPGVFRDRIHDQGRGYIRPQDLADIAVGAMAGDAGPC
jgi:hypothetical protein